MSRSIPQGCLIKAQAVTMTEGIWNETLGVNLKGTFFMCQSAIPALAETNGSIVNISSDAGMVGNNGLAVYCASKGM